ncbi:hypothetical protein GCM10023093_24760 [Nemorincola caseinilytica]|uniref:Uncharacterized protein n=1 Tax=Nemorincola caseinilytica TaxID=2054315 RepID=A0ABP8NLV5_9BACT
MFAQVEDSTAPPADLPEVVEAAPTPAVASATDAPAAVKKPAVAPRPRPAAVQDTIKGNARNDVSFVALEGGCSGEMKGIAITNKSETRTMMVRVDVSVMFNGRMSKKSTLVDNLSPKEVRTIGCTGCIDKPTGKACTSYKIIAAAFKN